MGFVETVVNWGMPYSDQCIGVWHLRIRTEFVLNRLILPYTGEGFVNGTVGLRPLQDLLGPECRLCASLRPYLLDQNLGNCEDISLVSSDIHLQPSRSNSNHILGVDRSEKFFYFLFFTPCHLFSKNTLSFQCTDRHSRICQANAQC